MRAEGIRICGLYYPFWYDREVHGAIGGARGQYLGDEQKVFLDPSLPEATWLRTVLHESIHGILGVSTLCAGGDRDREISGELEEKLCTLLEREIPALFADNPWLKAVLKR